MYQRLGLEDDIVDPSNALLREGPVLKISFRRRDPTERYLFLVGEVGCHTAGSCPGTNSGKSREEPADPSAAVAPAASGPGGSQLRGVPDTPRGTTALASEPRPFGSEARGVICALGGTAGCLG